MRITLAHIHGKRKKIGRPSYTKYKAPPTTLHLQGIVKFYLSTPACHVSQPSRIFVPKSPSAVDKPQFATPTS